MSDSAISQVPETLSALVDGSLELVESIDQSLLDSNSSEYQTDVKKAIQQLEQATTLVNDLQLFSNNESLEEVASVEIKYMLLPALLGFLALKQQGGDRLEHLTLAKAYFEDYIKRLNAYGIVKVRLEKEEEDEDVESKLIQEPDLQDMAKRRNEKLNRYRSLKQMNEKLASSKSIICGSKGPLDDEFLRNYHLTLLKKWTAVVLDELDSTRLESKMLAQMGGDAPKLQRSAKPRKPMKPFIITKNDLQKKVFGLGYPSIPTMTVDAFVDEKMAEGTWAFDKDKEIYEHSLHNYAKDPERKALEDENDDEKKDRLEDEEDEEWRMRTRGMDEYKDEHKRGEGNRKNMS